MEEVSKTDARGGVTSRKHKVGRVLVISLALAVIVGLVLYYVF